MTTQVAALGEVFVTIIADERADASVFSEVVTEITRFLKHCITAFVIALKK
jgi:hypothetical protein